MPVEVQGTLDLSGILADGRIKEDGDLTVSIAPFYYDISGTKGYYGGSVGNEVTDGYTNYIYLDNILSLNINISGYPATGVSHIRLGRVVALGGFVTRIISERALFTDASSSSGNVPETRTITAGDGLSGGGNLSANRTIDVVANADGSIIVNTDDIQVGVLATDAQHGLRGGDNQHAAVTTTSNGFMSAADKIAINTLVAGDISITIPVRNETGDVLSKGRAVAVVGLNQVEHAILVNYADKDTSSLRPALAVLSQDLPNNTNAFAMTQGLLHGIDTSMWGLTDQLVLGNDGYLVRPPPDNSPFTGEVQNIGSTARIDAVDGYIMIGIDGQEVVTAEEVFALVGTYGTPGSANKYVTETDPRVSGSVSGVYHYANSATDPVSPVPQDGYEYFNSALEESMRYDGTRSKWLSVSTLTFLAGRAANTAAGSYYRGQDNVTFGANIGYPVPKGTVVGISVSKTDSDASVLEVVLDSTVVTTLSANSAGLTANLAVNADFNQGLLKFRNQVGGNITTDVQITVIVKRRV